MAVLFTVRRMDGNSLCGCCFGCGCCCCWRCIRSSEGFGFPIAAVVVLPLGRRLITSFELSRVRSTFAVPMSCLQRELTETRIESDRQAVE